MSETAAHHSAPPAKPSSKKILGICRWLVVLAILSGAWFMLLATKAPLRLEMSGPGAVMMMSAPPILLTLIFWIGMQRTAAPRKPAAESPINEEELGRTVHPEPPPTQWRIGAWSALTPHGNAFRTVEASRARVRAFKPDKAILHPSGYPAHAGMIDKLDLSSLGYPQATRMRAQRVAAMLRTVLGELHAQQASVTEAVPGPVNVFWLAPMAPSSGCDTDSAIFDVAWKHSAWRENAYLLSIIRPADATIFAILSSLQNGAGQPPLPYVIVVAADSLLDPEELAPALALGQVFSHTSPDGFVPSEGAGGVLLFNAGLTPDDLWLTAAILGPVQTGASTGDGALIDVMSTSIAQSGKSFSDIGVVLSDSDHRTSSITDVVGAMVPILTTLDPLHDRISPREYAGSLGSATDSINLALAVELAEGKSALVFGASNGSASAVVVIPA